ncbi:glycoside hydrolase family 79 protein [Gautieria morchelliformis]|nr:glycoside hydrolase family 79 protein [Gautieria morchelliformis]
MRAVLSLLLLSLQAHAGVTIYTQVTFGPGTATTTGTSTYTAAAAYDPTSLTPPPVPSPSPANQFPVQLFSGGMANLSIPQSGAFVGFSVELSVADQIFGKNGTHINPPFLNLLANIKARAGRAIVRVGGNTQEKAVFFPQGLSGGATILKDKSNVQNPTDTPTIQVGVDLLFAMSNITSLVNTQWFLGLPFNDTSNLRLGIAESGEQILGASLIGVQAGNEPDLYGDHGARPSTYAPADYVGEFGVMVQGIQNDGNIRNKTNLIGPSVCCNWTPEQVFDAGFLTNYVNDLAFIAITGVVTNPQDVFSNYLNHTSATNLVQPYLNTSQIALQNQKPLIMMETNTASCGGFPGLSDSFGAALWGLDFSLQMAFANFSGAMMHVGGQNVYYNPFTPPPGSLARKKQWTIGPMYYVSLIIAETLGSSNQSQVVDLFMNSNNIYTPGYAIYENGTPTRVALFNFITDPSGASNYTASISVGGSGAGQANASPSQISVRYFTAPSAATKGNFQWAGQTFGDVFGSDGTLQGIEQTITITCDTGANTCSVPVPAPGFALVFLTSQALQEATPNGDSQTTFATTAATVTLKNTATIDSSVLATSNGRGGSSQQLGSTSFGSSSGAMGVMHALPGALALACMAAGAAVVGHMTR